MIKNKDKFKVIEDHEEDNRILKKDSVTILMNINENGTYYVNDLETSKTFTVPINKLKRMP